MGIALRDVMTPVLVTVSTGDSCAVAARKMADAGIGDVLVQEQDGRVAGIVTDRDIVVRAVAKGRDPETTPVGEVCTRNVLFLSPGDDVDAAMRLMKEWAVRRVPVVENDLPIGIVTLGDLAQERAPDSVLGRVSSAPPND